MKTASKVSILVATTLAAASLLAAGATAGNAWGNDRQPDWNDAQCDDDEGKGNDWKCEGTSTGTQSSAGSGGHGWGNDRQPDWNDAQCDDDEGTGNDWKCEGGSKGK